MASDPSIERPRGAPAVAPGSGIWRAACLIAPRKNPEATIYGLLAIAALMAAESGRHESWLDTVLSAVVAAFLYWLPHSYARVLGERLDRSDRLTPRALVRSLLSDYALLRGAAIPIGALLVAWAAGASQATGVLCALWVAVVSLVAFELAVGIRAEASASELALEAGVGAMMGVAVLSLKIILVH